MGLQFYSRLPIAKDNHQTPNLSNIAPALAFTSLIIGIIPALILFLGAVVGLAPLFIATISIALWILITGAMSEDAIADSSDGLFGGQSKEQVLKIFKDSTLGTYGVSALVIYIALRVFALSAMISISPLTAACLWLAATILARSSALSLSLNLKPARSEGASASIGQIKKTPFLIGFSFAVLISFALSAPFVGLVSFFAAIIIIIIISLAWTAYCRKKINGQTGDLIGANQALIEIGILAIFLIGIV
jgi:adenosylcobinamide-GDP ribazoletransferase